MRKQIYMNKNISIRFGLSTATKNEFHFAISNNESAGQKLFHFAISKILIE